MSTTPDPEPDTPPPPEPDVRTPKDGDEVVRDLDHETEDDEDNPLESIGKAVSDPVRTAADPDGDERRDGKPPDPAVKQRP